MAIELNEQTEKELENAARQMGVSVDEFVRLRVLGRVKQDAPKSSDEIDTLMDELDSLSTDGAALPSGFSRADIYPDEY